MHNGTSWDFKVSNDRNKSSTYYRNPVTPSLLIQNIIFMIHKNMSNADKFILIAYMSYLFISLSNRYRLLHTFYGQCG